MPVMESKPADVFAFGMFAVEVFTGKIPFEEQKNEAVVLQISRGGRPVMPTNAQAVGLTTEMWKLLESCWQQNPKKRPTMDEVVRRWEAFVEHEDDNEIITECVKITSVFLVFSISDRSRKQPTAEPAPGTGRPRAKTMAGPPPRTKSNTTRSRTMSEAVQPRTISETDRPRRMSEAVQPGIKLEAVQPQERPRNVQVKAQSAPLQPSECLFPGRCQS